LVKPAAAQTAREDKSGGKKNNPDRRLLVFAASKWGEGNKRAETGILRWPQKTRKAPSRAIEEKERRVKKNRGERDQKREVKLLEGGEEKSIPEDRPQM